MAEGFLVRSEKQVRLSLNDCIVDRIAGLRSMPTRLRNTWLVDLEGSLRHLVDEEEIFLATLWDLQAELVAIEEVRVEGGIEE